MIATYAVYSADGKIQQVVTCGTSEIALANEEGWEYLEADSPISDATHFVDNGQIAAKATFGFQINKTQITSDGVDEALLTNIPAGTTVEWPDGQVDEVTDGEVGFSVDLPGTHTLIFDAVPYLREEVTIEAVAAT